MRKVLNGGHCGQALLSQHRRLLQGTHISGPANEQAVRTQPAGMMTKLSSLQVHHPPPPQKQIRCSMATNQKLLQEKTITDF